MREAMKHLPLLAWLVSEEQALKIEAIANEQVGRVTEKCCFLCVVREKANTTQRAWAKFSANKFYFQL